MLRRFARAIRHLPDRLLHPLRRRLALARLRRHPPQAVLFICHGNICRSPYAAAAFAAVIPSAWRGRIRVASAGFIGAGRPAPAEAITVAARLGLDLRAHRSAVVTPAAVHAVQLVAVMDTDQAREIIQRFGRRPEDVLVLGDLDPAAIDTRTIRDPVEQPIHVFESTYARIDRCVSQLVKAIAGGGHAPRVSGRV